MSRDIIMTHEEEGDYNLENITREANLEGGSILAAQCNEAKVCCPK